MRQKRAGDNPALFIGYGRIRPKPEGALPCIHCSARRPSTGKAG
jgi:hypothetical protein